MLRLQKPRRMVVLGLELADTLRDPEKTEILLHVKEQELYT